MSIEPTASSRSMDLDRLALALRRVKVDEVGGDYLESLLDASLVLARAGRGGAVLVSGPSVVAEAARGDDARFRVEARRVAAHAALDAATSDSREHSVVAIDDGRLVITGPRLRHELVAVAIDRGSAQDPADVALVGALVVAASQLRVKVEELREASLGAAAGVGAVSYLKTVPELVRDAVELALRQTNWHKEAAARKLGISRASIYVKVKKYGLERPPVEG
jgi:hypothetical protein